MYLIERTWHCLLTIRIVVSRLKYNSYWKSNQIIARRYFWSPAKTDNFHKMHKCVYYLQFQNGIMALNRLCDVFGILMPSFWGLWMMQWWIEFILFGPFIYQKHFPNFYDYCNIANDFGHFWAILKENESTFKIR